MTTQYTRPSVQRPNRQTGGETMVETGIVNALLQGIVTGGIIAAGALGLSLVYSIAEVPNFAHGDMLTVGAYLALA